MILRFIKAQSLGNDFVIVPFPYPCVDLSHLARVIANRRLGVGCDQIVFLNSVRDADALLLFYNADGSKALACLNGTRSVVLYLMATLHKRSVTLKVGTQRIHARLTDDHLVETHFIDFNPRIIPLFEEDGCLLGMYVNVGNPHFVCQENPTDLQVRSFELQKRIHELDATLESDLNVGFVQIVDPHTLALRVYERGAGETPACGSGTLAAFIALRESHNLATPCCIRQSGGNLFVSYEEGDYGLCADAHLVFEGSLYLNL